MKRYLLKRPWDINGNNISKRIGCTDDDRRTFTNWMLDHKKGREFVKRTFGEMHFMWEPLDPVDMPITDYPYTGWPGGIFSQKAIDILGCYLETEGDLHPVIMTDLSTYYLFDCWSRIALADYDETSITISTNIQLPVVFNAHHITELFVSEDVKRLCEQSGLTGMVFSPVKVIRV